MLPPGCEWNADWKKPKVLWKGLEIRNGGGLKNVSHENASQRYVQDVCCPLVVHKMSIAKRLKCCGKGLEIRNGSWLKKRKGSCSQVPECMMSLLLDEMGLPIFSRQMNNAPRKVSPPSVARGHSGEEEVHPYPVQSKEILWKESWNWRHV